MIKYSHVRLYILCDEGGVGEITHMLGIEPSELVFDPDAEPPPTGLTHQWFLNSPMGTEGDPTARLKALLDLIEPFGDALFDLDKVHHPPMLGTASDTGVGRGRLAHKLSKAGSHLLSPGSGRTLAVVMEPALWSNGQPNMENCGRNGFTPRMIHCRLRMHCVTELAPALWSSSKAGGTARLNPSVID